MSSLPSRLRSVAARRPRLLRAYRRIRYGGVRYVCPFCNSHLRTLLPVGLDLLVFQQHHVVGAGRRRALCPVCGSTDRERLIYLYLATKTRVLDLPIKLLHFAPEPNLRGIFERHKNVEYLTADLSKWVRVKVDITKMPIPDHAFDAIICSHVLEHVTDDRTAMRELYRVLKPQGWAIVLAPIGMALANTYEDPTLTSATERERAFGQKDHVRIYGRDFAERLEQAGFTVSVFQWSLDPDRFGGARNRFGLNPAERVYVAQRPT